jgi:23S rRNA U2552 (ribose-2'-O)-methylase RlmE/FtsJ
MIEILNAFRVDEPYLQSDSKFGKSSSEFCIRRDPIKTFHLAEGPGGFIEAVCNKRANPLDSYTGMTILYDEMDDNVPAWNKTEYFLTKNPNVYIETGADGTGNIMRLANFDHCVSKYGSTMDLITADGGFDFSTDFNKQELIISNLLWGQMCYALCMQKYGGNFVLKIFDCFYEQTVDILYLLSAFYSEVNVCKLQTSRLGNSEKYVICRGFRCKDNSGFFMTIRESFRLICQNEQLRISHLMKHTGTGVCEESAPTYEAHSRIKSSTGLSPEYFAFCLRDRCEGQGLTYEANSLIESSSALLHIHPRNLTANTECSPDFFAKPVKFLRPKNPFSNFNSNNLRVSGYSSNASLFEYGVLPKNIMEVDELQHVSRFIDCPIPRHFVKRIEEMNAVFGQQQIENIHYTISIIDKNPKYDRLEQLTKQNMQKCVIWCVEHGIAYNNFSNANMFVSDTKFETKQIECTSEGNALEITD